MNLVVDTPIFVGLVLGESNQALHRDLLVEIYEQQETVQLFEPFLFCFEFLISVSRGSKSGAVSKEEASRRIKTATAIIKRFLERPNAEFVSLDDDCYRQWLPEAEKHNFQTNNRTQDDIFLSLAVQKDAILVTLDENILRRPTCSVGKARVATPYDILKELKAI